MPHRIIHTPEELDNFIKFMLGLKLPFTVEWVMGRDRTRDQNSLQWLWANEVARQLGDRTADDVQREWKLRHGVPILREDSATFREVYDRTIKPLIYERKVEAMEFIDVTSIMKVRQMVQFLDRVERECIEQGLVLTNPDPSLSQYMSRYRNSAP